MIDRKRLPEFRSVRGLLLWFAVAIAPAAAAADLPAADAPAAGATAPRVGLVLAGGGARGLAHIGVIKYLEEHHIRVSAVAGTSMGSIIGGLYASGMNARQIEQVALTLDWRNAFSDSTPRDMKTFRHKQEDYDFLSPLKLHIKDGKARLPMGAVEGQHLNRILQDLVGHVSEIDDFDQLPIPFRAVAADIATGDAVVIGHGNLAVAMRASMSIPAFFAPVDLDGRLLVDGGIAKNIPVDVAQGMGVDRLIVVDIGTPLAKRDGIDNMVSLVGQLTTIMTRKNSERQIELMQPGDVLVLPALDAADVQTMSFDKARLAIDLGYQAATALAPQFAALADPVPGPAPAGIAGNAPPPRIDAIRIVNDSEVPDELLAHLIRQRPGAALDKPALDRDIEAIYALDQFSRVDYRVAREGEQHILEVSATANPGGISYMKFGISWDQDSKGDSEFGLRASWRKRGLNRLGGEWYTLAQLGGRTQIGTQWYQPLDIEQRFNVQATYEFGRRTVNLLQGDDVIARMQESTHRVNFGPGVTFGNIANLRIGAFGADTESDLEIGAPALDSRNNHDAGYFAEFRLDTLDRPYFPGAGTRIHTRYQSGSSEWGADVAYDAWDTQLTHSFSVGANTFTLLGRWAALDLDDGNRLTLPSQAWSLGGLFALSGHVRDSMAGNYLGLAEIIYYRRLNKQSLLPVDFPLYIGASLEAGNVWLERDQAGFDDLEYAGSVFLGLDSPLGPLYMGIGRTEENRYALYLQIGKLFD